MRKISTYRWILLLVVTLFISVAGYAQSGITVKGKVTDNNKNPLAGVTVIVKGAPTPIGVMTDKDGNYQIVAPNEASILEASYLSFNTITESVGAKRTINFVMQDKDIAIDDVVVIGYGVQRKSHLTGAISKLEGSSLEDFPVSDITTALQGQIPGVTINNNTSEVGISPQIRVRGVASISASSSPLVVVDGFILEGGLSDLNMADVASIEVLKDAASAAIYGSQAANGVIMVTTKSGTPDKPRYSLKFYSGFKYAYKLHDLMNSKEYMDRMLWEESVGGLVESGVINQAKVASWMEDNIGYTNWQKESLRTAKINNIQFSVSGGKNESKYYVSAAYTQDEGIMLQNSVDKVNFRGKVDSKLSRRAALGFNVAGTYQKSTRPMRNFIDFYRTPSFLPVRHNDFSTALTGATGFARGSDFLSVAAPDWSNLDSDGNPTWITASPFSSANPNPMSVLSNTKRWEERFNMNGNVYFTYDIIKGLQFKTVNGVDFRYQPSYTFMKLDALKQNAPTEGTYRNALYVKLLTENTLTYTKKLAKHNIVALVGYTAQSKRGDFAMMTGTGFANDDIETLNAANSFIVSGMNNGISAGTGTYRNPKEVLESYLSRLIYDYADKYLMSASIRLDRSSLFRGGKRNAWFPSISLGWRVSEEDFMKPITWISSLKLRASYGVTGNNSIPYNATYDLMGNALYGFGSDREISTGLANLGNSRSNSNITWEQTDEWNYGVDLSLLRNRINLGVDYYYSITRHLLYEDALPSFTGFSYEWSNVGKVRNRGVEVQLSSINITKKNFRWETNVNIATNKNKVIELGGEYQKVSSGERDEGYLSRVGSPITQFFGFKTIGIWQSQEEIDSNPHFPEDVVGGFRVLDTDKNGRLTDADRVPLGDPYPDFTWGMTNSFKIYDFDVSFLFQGVQGITVYNGDLAYLESQKWNKAFIKNRWVSPSHPGNGKMQSHNSKGKNMLLTDAALEDASYMCLRNVTIGYTLPKHLLKKIGISSLRIYASGANLLYVWAKDYRGINPESRSTTSQYSNPLIAGYQRGGFPNMSTITFGLDINF